jgi:lysophospholipase L1-like esterase
MLQSSREDHAKPPAPETVQRTIGALRQEIAALRARGVAVIFVEPPEHVALWSSPLSSQIRQKLRAAFPDGDVGWFPMDDPSAYQTVDGVHLDRQGAERFAAAIVQWLAKQP